MRASSKSLITAAGIESTGIESGAGAPSGPVRPETGSFESVRNRVHLAVTPQRRTGWSEVGTVRPSEVVVTGGVDPGARQTVQAKPSQLR